MRTKLFVDLWAINGDVLKWNNGGNRTASTNSYYAWLQDLHHSVLRCQNCWQPKATLSLCLCNRNIKAKCNALSACICHIWQIRKWNTSLFLFYKFICEQHFYERNCDSHIKFVKSVARCVRVKLVKQNEKLTRFKRINYNDFTYD